MRHPDDNDATSAGPEKGGEAEPDVSSAGPEEATDLHKALVEAILFASDRPVTARRIAEVLREGVGEETAELDGRSVRRLVDQLRAEYDAQGRAFQIEEIAGGFQMLTRPEYHHCVRALSARRQQAKLSPAALETLAVIAYKQPVSRATIEDIRGVQTGQLIRTLMEKRLVRVVGREEVPGRPLLYGTTREFLEHFGLKSLKDLPGVHELSPPAGGPLRADAPGNRPPT